MFSLWIILEFCLLECIYFVINLSQSGESAVQSARVFIHFFFISADDKKALSHRHLESGLAETTRL